jgi:hypothetical protein
LLADQVVDGVPVSDGDHTHDAVNPFVDDAEAPDAIPPQPFELAA